MLHQHAARLAPDRQAQGRHRCSHLPRACVRLPAMGRRFFACALFVFARRGPAMARARAHPERDPWPGEADLAACCVSLPCRALASQVNIGNPMVGPQQAAGKPSESCFHLSRFSGTRAGGMHTRLLSRPVYNPRKGDNTAGNPAPPPLSLLSPPPLSPPSLARALSRSPRWYADFFWSVRGWWRAMVRCGMWREQRLPPRTLSPSKRLRCAGRYPTLNPKPKP